MLQKSVDPLTNPTTYSYSSTYYGAFPTTVTNALGQIVTLTYDFNTGLMMSMKDPNNETTNWTWDCMVRLTQANYPDGGQSSVSFTYNPSNGGCGTSVTSTFASATLTKKITSSLNLVATQIFDGLGRPIQTKATVPTSTCPSGYSYVNTTYDGNGRTFSVSNPFCTTTDTTYGLTTTYYDPLSRPCLVVPPDGTAPSSYSCPTTSPGNDILTAYSGACTTVTDQASKSRKSCTDGLGRLTGVWEDPNGLNYPTSYTYDALNDLISVAQNNSRQRTFAYDSLARLTQAANPESNSTSYTYDADGNVLTKTDARGYTINYSPSTLPIDALNRVREKTYSNGDPSVTYNYDGNTTSGCSPTLSISNPIGRRTSMCDAAGNEAWSYDSMGRVLLDQRTTNSLTKSTTYSYNFDGSMATLSYPSLRTLTYTPNAAAQPVSAVDTAYSINYAVGPTTCPNGQSPVPTGGVCYTPIGTVAALQNGSTLVTTSYYNTRLQPCRVAVNSSGTAPTSCGDGGHAGNVLDYIYSFDLSTMNTPCSSSFTSPTNSGDVASITNNVTSARSQNYCYDTVNRILKAETTSTSGTYCWGEQYGYDAWGNLLSITAITPQYNGCSQESGFSNTMSASNQIVGFCYDAAGNLLAQSAPPCSSPTYTYNAENELTSTAGVTYTYDGDGKRVEKSNGKLYWYGTSPDPLDETNASGSLTYEYIFFGGKRIARRDSSGNVDYYFADHLGTARVVTNATGTVPPLDDSDFYPFGGQRSVLSSSGNTYKFTGKERDSESGLDNFGARYNSSQYGRFMSPDPMGGKRADPQTLNKYSYVRNNPLNLTDPTGLYIVNCTDGSTKDQKNCNNAADQFEKQRQKDLNSKHVEVRDAAKAWGNRGEDNHVDVTFKSQQQVDADAQTQPGYKTDAIVTPGATSDHQPSINAEFSEDLRGKDLAQTIAHEGSHLEDQMSFLNSYNPVTGQYSGSQNSTHFYTEFNAFEVGSMVKPYTMFSPGPKGYQGLTNYINRAYPNEDQLVFPTSVYPQGNPPL